jgi:hypothetical protein
MNTHKTTQIARRRTNVQNTRRPKRKTIRNRRPNPALENHIDAEMGKMLLGSVAKQLLPNNYLHSLLFPEYAFQARVPGRADLCVPLHRKLTYTLTTNILGNASIILFPAMLSDSTAAQSTTYVYNAPTYDAQAVPGVGGNIFIDQQITPYAVRQYRLVSASMQVTPQASVLNQAGTIYAAMLKLPLQAPASGGVANVPLGSFPFIPLMQSLTYTGEASVSAQEGARITWVPNDECLLEFTAINTNIQPTNLGEYSNAMMAVIAGCGTSPVNFRIDIFQNFEVVPAPGSILIGMESIAQENIEAKTVWRTVLTDHDHDIVRCSKSISSVSIKIDPTSKLPADTIKNSYGVRTDPNSDNYYKGIISHTPKGMPFFPKQKNYS